MYKKIVIGLLIFYIFTGCATMVPLNNDIKSGKNVGDKTSTFLNEIIVSVPIEKNHNTYQNLHIIFAAIINPTERSLTSPDTVSSIVKRSFPRISSQVIELILTKKVISINDLPNIRREITLEAQKVFDNVFSKWIYSNTYEVELVVTSFFLTNGSVGKSSRSMSYW